MSEIINFYEVIPKSYLEDSQYYNPNKNKGVLIHPFRCAIVGGSGAFKTNTAMNIINSCNCFDRFYVIAKKSDEPLYKYLTDALNKVSQKWGTEMITVSEDLNDVPSLKEDIDPTRQNLIIVDDMICEKLAKSKNLNEIFTMGRKSNCSVMIISQSYFAIPKTIRLNCNYFILKKINSKRDIRAITSEFSLDKSIDEVYAMYQHASKGVNFFMIDLNDSKDPNMRYRMNFKTPIK